MIDPGQKTCCSLIRNRELSRSAETADAPRRAAATAATTTTAAATTATSTTTTTAAATTTAAPGGLLSTARATLVVEEMEGREAHVSDFFLAEDEALIGNCINGFGNIICRQRGCGCCIPRQRKAETSETQSRHCGGFGDTLPLRSLFHP